MSISDYWELELLDHTFNNAAAPAITTPYVSLHTADPGEDGSNECSGGSYIRKAGSFTNASAGAVETDANLTWTNMPACTVQYVGVWDAESSGNFIWGGQLSASKTLNAGDTFQVNSGDFDVTLD